MWRFDLANPVPAPGPPNLTVTPSIARVGGELLVTLVVNNSGGVATNVQATAATLQATGAAVGATNLPQSFGNIGSGLSSNVTLRFPGGALRRGQAATLRATVTFNGGTPVLVSVRTRLP